MTVKKYSDVCNVMNDVVVVLHAMWFTCYCCLVCLDSLGEEVSCLLYSFGEGEGAAELLTQSLTTV